MEDFSVPVGYFGQAGNNLSLFVCSGITLRRQYHAQGTVAAPLRMLAGEDTVNG